MVDPKGLNQFAHWSKHHLSHLKLFVIQFGPHIHVSVTDVCIAYDLIPAEILKSIYCFLYNLKI